MIDSTEKTLQRIEQYFSIIKKVLKPAELKSLESSDLERLALCPRGLTDETGGYAGALVDYSLEVALKGKAMASFFSVEPKSIVKVALLHELGRMGHLNQVPQSLYLNQDSDWHREKLGQNYKYNENCPRMNIGHRTLWMLNELGIQLSYDEYLTVLTSQGFHLQENSFYAGTAPPLALLLQAARTSALTR